MVISPLDVNFDVKSYFSLREETLAGINLDETFLFFIKSMHQHRRVKG